MVQAIQLELDLDAAIEQRDLGMARAAAAGNNKKLLAISREVAEQIATEKGTVTCEDVRAALTLMPQHHRRDSQNWMGSMFKDRRFVWTGKYVKCRIPCNHANNIKVGRLAR